MKDTIQYFEKELAGLYPESEIEGLRKIVVESVCGWSFTEQVLQKNEKIGTSESYRIKSIVQRLKNSEPIQYILGETEFYGLKFKVNPSVLIPRPETEELVHWIIKSKIEPNSRILDIGTGSGCIAIALKNCFKEAEISGMDISEKALETARENSVLNGLDVKFFKGDILNWQISDYQIFDVIVSNPPYVRESEKSKMHNNVLNFEPGTALFVNDSDPLIFYMAICSFAKQHLNESGFLFFEINENLVTETKKLLMDFGFQRIEIRKDIHNKNRMIGCRKEIG